MCKDCGCSQALHEHHHHNHSHLHPHEHPHLHPHEHEPKTVPVMQSVLDKNDRLAERNRGYFLAKNLLTINILSSPGSGKTSLIEKTVQTLPIKTGIVVGDLETDNDAQRIRNTGVPAIQITTGTVCHLEADMVLQAAQKLDLDALDLLIIENVGNLVCPAAYDLGENLRVVLLSVTEGEDKPLKYPTMFKTANVVIVNKIDITEAVGFNREIALTNIQKVAPQATIFEVSARTGQGIESWLQFLESQVVKNQKVSVLNY
jgi:hydrogenase nickel incorporation protein HypB